ncbi:coiled-coil domain-containing protein [Flavobacterium beibuense]|uniref:hypothetical protein n=1 Tax=Flavobacterium beibuense TaxID=657326 RepID=UPI00068E4B50|nr:hypothetical protein [Flavobacterium beibuense]
MKKLLLITCALFFVNIYGQDKDINITNIKNQTSSLSEEKKKTEQEIEQLNKKLSEITKDLDKLREKEDDSLKTIIYDFSKGHYTRYKVKPRVGIPVVYKIININRLAYDITITSEDIAIADEYFNPEIQKKIEETAKQSSSDETITTKNVTSPTLTTQQIKENSKTADEKLDKEIENIQKKIKEQNDEYKKTNSDISDLKSNIAQLDNLLKQLDKNDEEFVKTEKDITEKREQLNKNFESLENQKIKLEYLEQELSSLRLEKGTQESIQESIYSTFDKLRKAYANVVSKSKEVLKLENDYFEYRALAVSTTLSYDTYIEKSENKICNRIDLAKKILQEYEIKITEFNELYREAVNNWRLLDKLETNAKDNTLLRYNLIKSEVDNIQKIIASKKIFDMLIQVISINNILSNKNSYEFASSPIQPLEDYVSFSVKLKRKHPDLQSEAKDREFSPYLEYTKGGVRFDFSTGAVFDFQLAKNENNYYYGEYIIEDYKDSLGQITSKQIKGIGRDRFKPSLAGMFHTSFRENGNFSFGLTLGASLNVETFELNSLFPGVSLLIGKKQKFIFTVGPAFKKVELLKENYQLNQDYDPTQLNDSVELTTSKYRIGLFFGITYNLTNEQKSKFKIQ